MKRVGRKDYAREYFEVDKTRYLKRDEWAKKRISDVLSMIEPLEAGRFCDRPWLWHRNLCHRMRRKKL